MEMDEDMNGDNNAEEGADNDQRLPNATLSSSNTSSTPTLTSTSTFPTHTISSSEAQLNALYNALQVATTIGSANSNTATNAASAVHVSSLLVQIGTLHLESGQGDMAASSFQSAISILERAGHDARAGTLPADNIRLCVETTALKSLGHIFFKKCHYQQAMSYFLRAHSKNNNTKSGNNSSKGEVLSDINILLAVACKHKASKEYRLSLDALLAASIGIEVAYGRFHELFVNVLVEAASIFRRIGETDAAANLSQQVLMISQQIQKQQQEEEKQQQEEQEVRRAAVRAAS